MNAKKMVAIVFIWGLAAFGWMVLGTVVTVRTDGLFDRDRSVAGGVTALWGEPQVQGEPSVMPSSDGAGVSCEITRSDVVATIDAHNRKRGLGWFPVYDVRFCGTYTVTNEGSEAQSCTVVFSRPKSGAEFLEQIVKVDGQPLPRWTERVTTGVLEPGESSEISFGYHSKGSDFWAYSLPADRMIREATVTVRINRADYDFSPDSSPADIRAMSAGSDGRYELVWQKKLVTNARDIKLLMPTRVQPGQLTSRISFFAPIGLGFFFVVMIAIQMVGKVSLHPMHYLFLAAGFFAFHLLMSYMVDHVELHASFWISAAVSVVLVIMYLWIVVGPRAAIGYAGLSQMVYLVLFSYSFFLANLTGLTITIGSIITLAMLMLLTARIKWGEQMPELERGRKLEKCDRGQAPVHVSVGSGAAGEGVGEPADEPPGFAGESKKDM